MSSKNNKIFLGAKRYPELYRKFSRRTLGNIEETNFPRLSAFIKLSGDKPSMPSFMNFRSLGRSKFNTRFNKFYFYEDIKRTGDKDLIDSVNSLRWMMRLHWTMYQILMWLFIIGFFVVLTIFVIAFIKGGGRF